MICGSIQSDSDSALLLQQFINMYIHYTDFFLLGPNENENESSQFLLQFTQLNN